MSALGGATPPSRRQANAYAANNQRGGRISVIMILATLFILRNILLVDYRKSTVDALKEAGRSDAEIERLVPKTSDERLRSERRNKVDYLRLQEDVANLKSEVEELKAIIKGNFTAIHVLNTSKLDADKATARHN